MGVVALNCHRLQCLHIYVRSQLLHQELTPTLRSFTHLTFLYPFLIQEVPFSDSFSAARKDQPYSTCSSRGTTFSTYFGPYGAEKPDFGSSRLVKTLRPLSGPLPRGKAVQVKACDILAAFALTRRRIRYSGVAKDAAFGPKWWPTIFVPRSLALWEAGLKGERGLRAPGRRLRPSSRHGGFQNCRGNASSTTAQELSTIGRKRRRHRRHCSHRPNRPTVGSRPRT